MGTRKWNKTTCEIVFIFDTSVYLIFRKNLFGSTECGAILLSEGPEMPLQSLDGMSYTFRPIASKTSVEHSDAPLLELVILAESPDCPDRSLRAADGHFHTGDLFQEVRPGYYISKGRDDDWIKSENSLRCDTKYVPRPSLLTTSTDLFCRAIEDNVRATCSDLVTECVVVGNGRPSPALFIETNSDMPLPKLKREILRRTRQFHSRRYLHERITSADMIVIVGKGTLPRTATKGNVRRKATEETFRTLLDNIYDAEWTGTS